MLTFAAVLLAGFVLLMLPLIIISSIAAASMSDKDVTVKEGTILTLDISEAISDRDLDSPALRVRNAMSGGETAHGLNLLRKKLEKAAKDDKISALYLKGETASANMANQRELRRMIADFKASSGKPVYYFSAGMDHKAAYVASAADSVFVVPSGHVFFYGCLSSKYYLKKFGDKYGIGFDVIKHGKYKSAVEPYFRDSRSDEDREQTLRFLNVMWHEMRDTIAAGRRVTPASVDAYTDNLTGLSGDAEAAVKAGLIDKVVFYDQFADLLRQASGKKANEKLDLVSVYDYDNIEIADEKGDSKDGKVAIVYACGQIYDGTGDGDEENIYGDDLAATLRTVRTDTTIKAVVMRVNSPGGSALASDIIWREVAKIKEDKPIVVSMGGYAASGGYYISCAANYIFAEPNTLTGSIGVFGMIPNIGGLANNLGVTFDVVSTAKVPAVTGLEPLSEPLRAALTTSVENTYNTFVGRVSAGRDMSFAAVDSIGGGRVWVGSDAANNGLVDALGNIDDAIDMAVELAGLGDNYATEEFPKTDDSMASVMKQLGLSVRAGVGRTLLGNEYDEAMKIKEKIEGPDGFVWAVCDEMVK